MSKNTEFSEFSIYKTYGELKIERAKETLEEVMNKLVDNIISKVNAASNDRDNW